MAGKKATKKKLQTPAPSQEIVEETQPVEETQVAEQPEKVAKEMDEDGKRIWRDENGEIITDPLLKKKARQDQFASMAKDFQAALKAMPSVDRKKHYANNAKKGRAKRKRLQGELLFPVKKMRKELWGSTLKKPTTEAAIFASAVVEYMAAEILELAGECVKDFDKLRIVPRYIMLAIRNDDEIDRVYPERETLIRNAGVVVKPVPKMLLTNKASRKNADWDSTAWYKDMDSHQSKGPKSQKSKLSQDH